MDAELWDWNSLFSGGLKLRGLGFGCWFSRLSGFRLYGYSLSSGSRLWTSHLRLRFRV